MIITTFNESVVSVKKTQKAVTSVKILTFTVKEQAVIKEYKNSF